MTTPRTSELVTIIQESVAKVNTYLTSSGHPLPSLDITGPATYPPLPPDIMQVRMQALAATDELHALLMGPPDHVLGSSGDFMDFLGLQFLHRYRIATIFPPGEKTYRAQLKITDTTRFLRLAMTYHVFKEPREGIVAHTSVSKVLYNNHYAAAWLRHILENVWPTLPRVLEAGETWPGSEEPDETAYVLTHPKGLTPFGHLKASPPAAKQFSDAMKFFQEAPGLEAYHLLSAIDFSSLKEDALFVDVGGSHGAVSISVARTFTNMRFIVQDLPVTIAKVASNLPTDVQDRISFMEHDFFTEQPIKDADVYYFRWIFHDWSDLYSMKILRALIPGLKAGSKIIISDICLPAYGQMPLYMQKLPRSLDMVMKAQFNFKECQKSEWISLFEKTDSRFRVDSIQRPMEFKMSFITVTWDP